MVAKPDILRCATSNKRLDAGGWFLDTARGECQRHWQLAPTRRQKLSRDGRQDEGRQASSSFVKPFKIKKYVVTSAGGHHHPGKPGHGAEAGGCENAILQNEPNLKSPGSADFMRVKWCFWGQKNEPNKPNLKPNKANLNPIKPILSHAKAARVAKGMGCGALSDAEWRRLYGF